MTSQARNGQQKNAPAQNPRGPWPSADAAVATILLGERYSNDRLHFISRVILLLTVALCISIIGNLAMLPNPPRYRYIPVSTSGLVLPQVPLTQPNHDDQYVVDWTIDAVTRLYSFDFMNYRAQLQDAQKNLTATGWQSFQQMWTDANNFTAVTGNNFVLTAVPTGAGKVTDKYIIEGSDANEPDVHAWTVEFPMLITYRSAASERNGVKKEGRIITQPQNMTVTVTRVGVFLNHTGLGIKYILGER
jgi:intracellular multiplication protein IcmL|nr:DotI/IcmL/TraM family protein [Neorhizobium tomejilense]